jgi:hypothetical protein
MVSMPRVSGVTSSRRTSFTSPLSTPRLDGGADGHDLVRVDALGGAPCRRGSWPISMTLGMRVMPPTRTSSSISWPLELGVLEQACDRACGVRSEQVVGQLLQLGAGERDVQVLRARGVGRDERQVDVYGVSRTRGRSWPSRLLP